MTATPYIELLEGGSSSLVVGVLDPDGEPFATRAWGITVVAADPLVLRVLVPAGSMARIGRHPGDGASFPLALTAANVESLDSVQVKGTARDLQAPAPEDLEHFTAYLDQFLVAINRVDGNELELLRRWAPNDVVACTVEVDELFDQTPGPGAGARLERRG
ncbi:MAG: hypothetical protein M3Z03_07255 [Actinomycetota bacterium]|nr:hypothetical protein [Actinomycetota bacterium]